MLKIKKLSNAIKILKTVNNWYDYLLDYWLKKTGIFKYVLRDGNTIILRLPSDDR